MKELKLPRLVVLFTLTAALGTIGFLAAGSIASGATRTNATVSLRSTKLGMILVNSKGRTLYLFEKDRSGKSACTSQCAQYWPPLLTHGAPVAHRVLLTRREPARAEPVGVDGPAAAHVRRCPGLVRQRVRRVEQQPPQRYRRSEVTQMSTHLRQPRSRRPRRAAGRGRYGSR